MGTADRRESRIDRGGGASGGRIRELPWFLGETGFPEEDPGRVSSIRSRVRSGSYEVRSELLASAILARLGIH